MFVQVEIWQVVYAEALHACVKNQNRLTCSKKTSKLQIIILSKNMLQEENSTKNVVKYTPTGRRAL